MNNIRRKELRRAIDMITEAMYIIDNIREEEQDSYDNLPEGLQYSDRGELLQDNADRLDEVYGALEDQVNEIDDIIE